MNNEFKPYDRVVLIREEGDMEPEDFGLSGLVVQSNLGRFGPWINSTFFYFGTLAEFPEWCIIATSGIVTSTTKHFAVRVDSIKKVE